MKLHADSHVDHGLTKPQVDYLLARFADREAFFIETLELPPELGLAPCDLVGPAVGGAPVPETEVAYAKRGARAWKSRTVSAPSRTETRMITVIAGPHDGQPCVLFTAYGGPLAPREKADIRLELEALEDQRSSLADRSPENPEHQAIYAKIVELRVKRAESDAFWADHALIV